MRAAWRVGLLGLATMTAGCVAVTINVTFPQEKIDDAAASIEDLVRTPKQPPSAPRSAGPSASLAARAASVLGPTVAEAQTPELKTRTPEVMAVIESRRGRLNEVSNALSRGCIGENNQGLLEVRPGTGCQPTVSELVTAENRDRMFLYRTLVEQNNMPPGDLARVQAAFAKAHRERAPAGAWVQDPGGAWVRK
jgi:uncharacterized protein YdbL (DUF1318 family)